MAGIFFGERRAREFTSGNCSGRAARKGEWREFASRNLSGKGNAQIFLRISLKEKQPERRIQQIYNNYQPSSNKENLLRNQEDQQSLHNKHSRIIPFLILSSEILPSRHPDPQSNYRPQLVREIGPRETCELFSTKLWFCSAECSAKTYKYKIQNTKKTVKKLPPSITEENTPHGHAPRVFRSAAPSRSLLHPHPPRILLAPRPPRLSPDGRLRPPTAPLPRVLLAFPPTAP